MSSFDTIKYLAFVLKDKETKGTLIRKTNAAGVIVAEDLTIEQAIAISKILEKSVTIQWVEDMFSWKPEDSERWLWKKEFNDAEDFKN